MMRTPWSLAAALLIVVAPEVFSQGAAPTPPIRQVDHIMIRTGAPRELYAFFTEVLQLPVAWPLISPRPGVTTGGVAFGNVNVEAIQFPGQKEKSASTRRLRIRTVSTERMSIRVGPAQHLVR